MSCVIHFEIQADNPQRAVDFYQTVFGWQVIQWADQEYFLCTTRKEGKPFGAAEEGYNGAITRRRGPAPPENQPVNAFVCTIEVANLEAALQLISGQGGKQVVDAVDVPMVGRIAYCKDTEGNVFGILEPHVSPSGQIR